MAKKLFTQAEANSLLPELREDLRLLQELSRQFEEQYMELQDRKADYAAKKRPASAVGQGEEADPFFEAECRLEFMRMEADTLISRFELKGVQLKMIDPGLIDFPALLNGREVLLCWKQGEDYVGHYHGPEDGFKGRKPLPL